jgi:uncharacterized protein (UPF0335 family)
MTKLKDNKSGIESVTISSGGKEVTLSPEQFDRAVARISPGGPMKLKRQFLFPELEPTAIELASLVGQLEAVEAEKKAVNDDFKERIELLKMQIKNAAKVINESMAGAEVKGGEASMLTATLGAEPDKLRAVVPQVGD